MTERQSTLLTFAALALVSLLACSRARVVLPDTPAAKECAQGCLDDLRLCKGSGQGMCGKRNDACLEKCPGATR